MLKSDVIQGTIIKKFSTEDFKGVVKLSNEQQMFIHLKFGGKTKEALESMVGTGQVVTLFGDARWLQDKNDKTQKTRVFEIAGILDSNGSIIKRGRLVKDAELAYTKEGKPYAKFTIAVDYGYGQNRQTDFVFCMLYGNTNDKNPAKTLAEKGAKGQEIIVHGKLDYMSKGDAYILVNDYQFIFNHKKDNPKSNETKEDDWNQLVDYSINDDSEDVPF